MYLEILEQFQIQLVSKLKINVFFVVQCSDG